ncbi:hypothetical protein ACVWW9_001654 [Agrococcus sp. UYP33]
MPRALVLAAGAAAIVLSIALGAIIVVVWQPCADAAMPLQPGLSPSCAAVTSGPNTGWIGLLWPLALAAAGLAAYRLLARGSGVARSVIVVLLAACAIAANPIVEYTLLNAVPQSWDEPPGTGALTALLFALAGLVLATTAGRRRRA